MGKKLYPSVEAGEWVKPSRKYYKLSCCDCGLVHKFEFKLEKRNGGKEIVFRCWRDNRATANIRRSREHPCKEVKNARTNRKTK